MNKFNTQKLRVCLEDCDDITNKLGNEAADAIEELQEELAAIKEERSVLILSLGMCSSIMQDCGTRTSALRILNAYHQEDDKLERGEL